MNNKDIGRQLAEINNLILRQKLADKTDDMYGITRAGSCIIAYLHDHSGIDVFQRDIEREFMIRRSTVSKALTLLEQKGYIERISVSSDHRLKKIALTKKAVDIVDKIKADRQNLEKQMTNNIDTDEIDAFKKTLEKIKQNLSQEDNG